MDVFGEKFPVPPELELEYVVATIDVRNEKLTIFTMERRWKKSIISGRDGVCCSYSMCSFYVFMTCELCFCKSIEEIETGLTLIESAIVAELEL